MMKRMLVLWFALGLSAGFSACDDETTGDEGEDGSTGDGTSDGSTGDGSENPDAGDGSSDAGLDAGAPDDAGLDAGDASDAGAGDAGEQAALEIAGRWHSNYGGTEVVDGEAWIFELYGSRSTTIEYDNDENSLILQNAPDDMYFPNKYSKVVWLDIVDQSFWYCTAALDLETLEDARAATGTIDTSAPETTGCNGFPWTLLSPVIEVEGTWGSETVTVVIDSDRWGEQTVVRYDNEENSAIVQNPNSGVAPLKFGKWEWVLGDVSIALCEVSSGEDTALLAESEASDADPEDFEMGCNGGGWTVVHVGS